MREQVSAAYNAGAFHYNGEVNAASGSPLGRATRCFDPASLSRVPHTRLA